MKNKNEYNGLKNRIATFNQVISTIKTYNVAKEKINNSMVIKL